MIRYVILNIADITTEMINLSQAGSEDNLRKNLAGTKAIIKFNTSSEYCKEVFSSHVWYAHKEIVEELSKPEWTIGLDDIITPPPPPSSATDFTLCDKNAFLRSYHKGMLEKVAVKYISSSLTEEYRALPDLEVGKACLKVTHHYTSAKLTGKTADIVEWTQELEDLSNPPPPPAFSNDKSTAFDGVNDYCNISHHPEIDFEKTDSFTFSFWFKTAASSTNIFFGKQQLNASGGEGYLVYLNGNSQVSILLQSDFSPLKRMKVSTNAGYNDNNWHFCCMTYDGTSNSNGITIYMDGVQALVTISDNNIGTSIKSLNDLKLCTRDELDYLYDGQLDEMAFWNKELSISEMTEVYNGGSPANLNNHSAAASIVLYYRFGDGDVYPIIGDQSTAVFDQHDATMVNMDAEAFVNDKP